LFELNSDPEVMRFLTGGAPTPRDEVRTRVIPTFLGYYERFEGFGFWAAVEIATGQFLGWFHFRPPLRDPDALAGWDEDGVIELGYRLRRSAWGKGYPTEGSRALIDRGFAELGVQRVVTETVAGNWGLPARAGEMRPDPDRYLRQRRSGCGRQRRAGPGRVRADPGQTGRPGTGRPAERGYPGAVLLGGPRERARCLYFT
jgi:RimJ/RimL family protein N-acetyltransferase